MSFRYRDEKQTGGEGVAEVAVFLFIFHSPDHVNPVLRSWVIRSTLKQTHSPLYMCSTASNPEVKLLLPRSPTHQHLILIHARNRFVGEWRHQIFHKNAASRIKATQEEEKKEKKTKERSHDKHKSTSITVPLRSPESHTWRKKKSLISTSCCPQHPQNTVFKNTALTLTFREQKSSLKSKNHTVKSFIYYIGFWDTNPVRTSRIMMRPWSQPCFHTIGDEPLVPLMPMICTAP